MIDRFVGVESRKKYKRYDKFHQLESIAGQAENLEKEINNSRKNRTTAVFIFNVPFLFFVTESFKNPSVCM